ncbi:MAG TPA: diguanylate cyclase [Magnetovibrio sp.]
MTADTLTMEQKLAQLRAVYAEKLEERIDDLSAHLKRMSDAGDDDVTRNAALEAVRQEAHKLAGSGATFGFPRVTEVAREMELACKHVLDGTAGYGAGFADRQYELCGRLREATQDTGSSVEEESQEIARAATPGIGADVRQNAVLLLDCDETEALQMQREMEHFGFDVRVVTHPSKLEAELAKAPIDVLVSGVMFGDDKTIAFNVLTDLRKRGLISAPLVVYTAQDGIASRLGAARAGAKAYLVKPLDIADLINELDDVTHRTEREPFRVMVIDDDESLARHTELVLQGAGMQTHVLTEPLGVLDALDDFSPELILLDLYMPKCSGSEIASVIRQRHEYAGIPIVFLSGEADKDKQLSAMELGGDDFLTKPIRPSHLISAVRIRSSRFRELRSFMVRDSMTGLYNHTTTKQLMETEIARAHRSGSKMSLASLDIDHFKNVNDTYGHAVGDRVIKALARLLRQRLRGVDVIGRMGGEEFAAILPETPISEAVVVFNQIRTAFSDIVFHTDDASFSVTISCGVAQFPDHGSATELSDAADKALYAAKHGGRNQVVRAE